MDLHEENARLVELLGRYLEGVVDHREMSEFAWRVIDYFSSRDVSELPPVQPFEQEFWHAIWEIQHLADEEHWKDGVTQRTLAEALAYLKGDKPMPAEYRCFRGRP